ncbi:OLC1v1001802C1 [Oldenlandia corymbosa var. corymbosa]|uniref:OLC1v1001802C1 n=1 Tax=Oldenlandia corymbosa var. corymbosa TaxID=529605 RepID=A0AAV1D637_OLDCO|nr:OLC1v1001802C1 [Oldenlandia corymbosa var. corymbosa]
MEESRQSDCRVPVISSIFFICLATGGVFLIMYVFTPSLSAPWYPIAAFVMIGIPWLFWLVTYIYACLKACFRRGNLNERQISRRNNYSRNAAPSSKNTGRNASISQHRDRDQEEAVDDHRNSPKDGKHVQFAEVVVMGAGDNGRNNQESSSVTSSKEIEMPLNVGVSSS